MHQKCIHPHFIPMPTLQGCNKSLAVSSIMIELSIIDYLNTIYEKQASATQQIEDHCHRFLQYIDPQSATSELFSHDNITKKKSNHGICGSIGYRKNNKTIILTYIGILVTINLRSIARRISLRNITKTPNEYVYKIKINCMPSKYVNCMLSQTLQMCVGTGPYIQRTMT